MSYRPLTAARLWANFLHRNVAIPRVNMVRQGLRRIQADWFEITADTPSGHPDRQALEEAMAEAAEFLEAPNP